MSLPALTLRSVGKRFGRTAALDAVSLEVEWGAILALLGPAGAGKSTLLRLIAGLERPTSGTIAIGGTSVEGLPPVRRRVGIVFQNPLLLRRCTVFRNVSLALRHLDLGADEVPQWVREALRLVDMEGSDDELPARLLPEERQRVALARALVARPALLLLDEPFIALGPRQRARMQALLASLHERLRVTTILATHNAEEALATAGRVALLERGRIVGIGAEELFTPPAAPFAADVIGEPNLLPCTICGEDEGYLLALLPNGMPVRLAGDPGGWAFDPEAVIVLPPQAIGITLDPPRFDDSINCLRGRVQEVMPLGTGSGYRIALEAGPSVRVAMREHGTGGAPIGPGQAVFITWRPSQARTVRATTAGRRAAIR